MDSIFKPPFFWPELYRRTGGMSIVFLFDENPDVASAGSGGVVVSGARYPDHSRGAVVVCGEMSGPGSASILASTSTGYKLPRLFEFPVLLEQALKFVL